MPFMYQTMFAPVEILRQRMSGLPSLLKSATPTIFQFWSVTGARLAEPVCVSPFMYQTMFAPVDILRQRMSASPSLLKSAVATILQAPAKGSSVAVAVCVDPFIYQTVFSPVEILRQRIMAPRVTKLAITTWLAVTLGTVYRFPITWPATSLPLSVSVASRYPLFGVMVQGELNPLFTGDVQEMVPLPPVTELVTVQAWAFPRFAWQLAVVPPFDPAQVQVHGPVPFTALALPAVHRLVVGAVVKIPLLAEPHWPLTGVAVNVAVTVQLA